MNLILFASGSQMLWAVRKFTICLVAHRLVPEITGLNLKMSVSRRVFVPGHSNLAQRIVLSYSTSECNMILVR